MWLRPWHAHLPTNGLFAALSLHDDR